MGCNIDKMLIKGIRSFSPDNQNVIEFYKPLTLIVGHNGAGKTTVIECLKMACTGELPPNTRSGQSFIHDPKVAGESEVKAQIKLRFITSTRQPVVIIRSFQLTQKKSTLQFKALDNVLQTINRETGSKEALSYRCADIDRIVPQLMGVSKAVLENVIFVHQEDSNWPLAEGQVLKKKFDDIFAATKYTKALEVLRKLQTEKAQEVKEMRLKLEHAKTIKDQAQKLKAEIESGSAKAAEYQQRIAELEADINAAQQRQDELSGQLVQIAHFGDDLTRLRTQYEMVARQNAEAYHRLQSAYGEDDASMDMAELNGMREQLEPALLNTEQEMRRLQREIQVATIDVEAAKEQYTRDVKQQGRLAAEAEAHARNLADLERHLKEVCSQAGIVPADGSQAAMLEAFRAKLAELTAQLDSTKAAHRKLDDDMGRVVDLVNAQLSGTGEAQRMKRDEQSRNNMKLQDLQRQMGSHLVNQGMLSGARESEQRLAAELAAKQEQLATSRFDEQVQALTDQLSDLARKSAELRAERDKLSTSAEGATRLRIKSQEVMQRESQLDAMRQAARQRLNQLLGRGMHTDLPSTEELIPQVAKAVADHAQELEGLRQEAARLQSSEASTQATLAAAQRQLEAAQKEQAALRSQLQGGMATAGLAAEVAAPATPARVVEERAKDMEEQQQADTERLAGMRNYEKIAVTFKRVAHDRNICMACERPFASVQEKSAFLAKQDRDVAQIPSQTTELQGKIQQAQQRLQQLRALQPAALRFDNLSTELPGLQRRVEELQAKLRDDAEKKEDSLECLHSAEAELENARKLQDEVQGMERLAWEVRERQAEVAQLQRDTSATAATRSVSDVDDDLIALDHQKAQLEGDRTDLQRRQNRLRDELASMRSDHQRAREELLRLESSAEKRAAIEAQMRELEQLNVSLQQEIDAAARERQPLEERRQALLKEREAKRAEHTALESRLEGQLRQMHTWDTQRAAKQRAVEEYVQLGKAEQLQRVNAALDSLRQRQEAGEAKLKELHQMFRDHQDTKAEQNDTKRQIDDLMAYHQGKAKEAELAAELDSTSAAQGNVGDRKAIQEEYDRISGRLQQLRSDCDMQRGSLATVGERVGMCQQELSVAQYHNIEAKYRQQNIELKTTEMAQSDLQKYHKALEKALLSFHTSKMSDINKIVKELWQKTYRNSDIDYIQIKADQEGAAGRSYNYRVVMHTGGAELDMRGRCSAGQKVLACLIIRLALAETFCLNCGILALDEPTTNLDADNSASLAEALRTIMQNRRDQENFQLVVITHDEQFARLIGTREHAEFMWRITKDDTQHSTITQEDIME
ncbi:hypothetical protein ABPG75_004480 [Micractinium tetrahymenae]